MEEQITFTEDELGELTRFANFITNNAKFNCTHKEFIEYDKLYGKFIRHLKKCEKHIMELKEFTEASDKGKQK